jgi:hypothetical protein
MRRRNRGRPPAIHAQATTAGRRPGLPSNEVYVGRVDFTPDPRGTALFARVVGVQGEPMSGHDGLVYVGDHGSVERSWNGDLGESPQAFTGAAALAMYGAVPPISAGMTLDQARSVDYLQDVQMRIFAARAARAGALQ